MHEAPYQKLLKAVPSVDVVTEPLTPADLNDLCDATALAIEAGGGFGWVHVPDRNVLERFWQGVLVMPARSLFVARLDGVICGSAQIIKPPKNNEAQAHAVTLTSLFIAPWARGQGLSRRLLDLVERTALKDGYKVINLDLRDTQQAAIKLYESKGYQLFAQHPCYAVVDGVFIAGRYYYKLLEH
jgi:ribosomal protein S18 acetylase RimI-like enzyme